MLGSTADFSVREQLTGEGFAEDQKLDGFTKGYLAVEKRDVLLAPRHFQPRFDAVEGDLLGKLLEALLVELDATHVVANKEFIQFFGRSAFHGVQELKDREGRFLLGEHALGQLGATGEAIGEIEGL